MSVRTLKTWRQRHAAIHLTGTLLRPILIFEWDVIRVKSAACMRPHSCSLRQLHVHDCPQLFFIHCSVFGVVCRSPSSRHTSAVAGCSSLGDVTAGSQVSAVTGQYLEVQRSQTGIACQENAKRPKKFITTERDAKTTIRRP